MLLAAGGDPLAGESGNNPLWCAANMGSFHALDAILSDRPELCTMMSMFQLPGTLDCLEFSTLQLLFLDPMMHNTIVECMAGACGHPAMQS